ncbi:MAG: 1-deoxy-D-xylulose-5-phosphate synthase [Synergistaceae bacterium]|jgi:1-deoxy-D-xylulose-5-phosphate synthase|nr:1-deoxy-D-xylulose-5-phosphate synthase [Synergistaceae bacterium]
MESRNDCPENRERLLKDGFGYGDLRVLPAEKLDALAAEVRGLILDVVGENGGHLGSSLGAVELCIALLRKFDPLEDRIVFDVGHQSYPYKILTDRSSRFRTLRTLDGVCGFPRRAESPFDHFDTGHSSTSISAALGYAKARDLQAQSHHVVAVIGDASLINGLAFEALNHIRETKTRLIIVLNDNKHSISPRVGGFATMLARLSASTSYNRIKAAIKECCRVLPKGEALERSLEGIHDQIKALVKPNNVFDDMDINYWGPFDGHDIAGAEMIFELAKSYDRPVLLHFSTVKGKGLPEAERNPTKYHQMSSRAEREAPKARTWSDAASGVTEELALTDGRVVCLTAGMSTGVKLENFKSRFPDRFFDVGIAESHMLTLAAGMAAGGLRPWVFIYSTFLQRAMDQLTHDIALQNLPVVLMIDRAGLVGADGETHQGLLDVSWARAVPNLEIYAPADEVSLRRMMTHAAGRPGPTVIRYPRGPLPESLPESGRESLGCVKIREGEDWALIGHGVTVHLMLQARGRASALGLPAPAVLDLRRLKPLDTDAVDEVLENYSAVVVAEEDYLHGGAGELIAARLAEKNHTAVLRRLGVPDRFIRHATIDQQREFCGLTAEAVLKCGLECVKVRARTA